MKSDSEIKKDVKALLHWDPEVDATDIAASIRNGVVTLAGVAASCSQKNQVERDVMGIVGVAGVANEIDVRIPSAQRRTDPDIAFDALNALNAYLPLWSKNMTVTVDKGWITLEGKAEWSYQSERAEEVVCFVRGVEGVTNRIEVKPRMTLETAPSAWKGIGRA